MAKQLGIHQIRGKVGERSYYKTKGVEAGISRSINQGLSARVKNGEEYANTRLNNAEFKNANAIATAAFNSVNNRKKGMMRNFAVAEMTKKALEDIKQGSGPWGARMPVTSLDVLVCDMLEKYAKTGAYDGQFGTLESAPLDSSCEGTITFNLSAEQVNALLELGIHGFQAITSNCLAGEDVVDGLPRLYAGHALQVSIPTVLTAGTATTVTIALNLSTPQSVGMSPMGYSTATGVAGHGYYSVVTFLPFRQEGVNRYLLQEYCTYVAVPLGEGAES